MRQQSLLAAYLPVYFRMQRRAYESQSPACRILCQAGNIPQLFKSCADPGNLLRTDNGRLGYLDFGMMADIEPKIRR